jgi:glyoxylase-like metal-dependent hydrolase (beta-lactamase superfamily II)
MKLKVLERAFALTVVAAGLGYGQQTQDFSKVEIHVLPVQGKIYMLVGAGGNITVQAGTDGVLLVDTMYAPLADKVVAAIRTISNGPIRYIVDTHVHGDHTGGNEPLRKAGSTITGGNVSADIKDSAEGAQIIAHQNILNRMSAPKGPDTAKSAAWPTDTYLGDEKDVFFNG